MSKPSNRGSLIGLKSTLPAMPRVAPVSLTADIEERILGTDVFIPGHTDVKTSVDKDTPLSESSVPDRLQPLRRKEPTVLMNAKLPVTLHSRLKRTAQFNDISMTDILVRAIEAELATGRYVAPPDTWGSELA